MEKYIQQLSTFTTDGKWCHLLSSLGIPASGIKHNSQKCICPNAPGVPMCPRLPYIYVYIDTKLLTNTHNAFGRNRNDAVNVFSTSQVSLLMLWIDKAHVEFNSILNSKLQAVFQRS